MRRVSWPVLIGALVGFALPVPLALLLKSVLQQGPALRSWPAETRVSPMLGFEERRSLLTYRRPCQSRSECEPPLGCFYEVRRFKTYCTDSQCMTDEQCPEGFVCRSMVTMDDGPLVRFCTPVGSRKEGESCVNLPRSQDSACGPGLLCGGTEGWCGRPCGGTDAAVCPEGSFCADVSPEPLCLPTCELRGCPQGQRCIRRQEGVSVCAEVYGTDCQQTPCADGSRCEVTDAAKLPGKVWMECVRECGKDHPPCPADRVCDRWHCLPACNPQGPNTCARGYHCDRRGDDGPWSCQPDYWPE